MSTIHAKGFRLSIETAPGSGEFREVATLEHIFDMPPPSEMGRFFLGAQLPVAEEIKATVIWSRINAAAFDGYPEWLRGLQAEQARESHRRRVALERATRVRPLRKKIKRFGRKGR